jgi:hypothetical protein
MLIEGDTPQSHPGVALNLIPVSHAQQFGACSNYAIMRIQKSELLKSIINLQLFTP